jgi:hypothetical protein
MNRSLNGSYQSTANSQEPAVAKKETTYASALRDVGIDEVFVARKLKDLLRAQGRRWNPKKGSWEKFEDYSTQLAALREIAKILDIYPKDPDDTNGSVRTINLSGIAICRERVSDGEQSTGRETGDGRERCER